MINSNQPLATRMRPRTLEEVVGQENLIGEGKILTRMVTSGVISSVILYGPPGTGKTSIANAMSRDLNRKFEYFNASIHSKKDLEKIVKSSSLMFPSIVLIDEVHRLTKQNQDYLLMNLEEGSLVIVGATTENPYMSINPALRSRSQVLELNRISSEAIKRNLLRALEESVVGLGEHKAEVEVESLNYISTHVNGDMRLALNTLELAVMSTEPDKEGVRNVTSETVRVCMQSKQIEGDKDGDAHYNLLSAFQKAIRGSDTDASLHYLARLVKIGDLISINRRLLVIAYEDIGLANPDLVAETLSAIETTERVGLPEARIVLSYITIRLALSRKSNVAYKAIELANKALNTQRNSEIPKSLHDTHYKGSKNLMKGEGYKYAHDYPYGIVEQDFMPKEFKEDRYLQFRDEDDTPGVRDSYEKINRIVKPNR